MGDGEVYYKYGLLLKGKPKTCKTFLGFLKGFGDARFSTSVRFILDLWKSYNFGRTS